ERLKVKRIDNIVEEAGARFNKGPKLEWVERVAGHLTRAKIDDLVPPTAVPRASAAAQRPRTNPSADLKTERPAEAPAATRQAAEKAASQVRAILQQKGAAPARLPVVRPFGVPGAKAKAREASPDSTR